MWGKHNRKGAQRPTCCSWILLHWSALLLFLLSMVVMILINWGENRTTQAAGETLLVRGWPFVYFSVPDGHLNRLDRNSDWVALLGDIVVALLICGAIAGFWEWRCRHQMRWWQFTLFDGLVMISLVAGGLGWWRSLYQDRECDRRWTQMYRELDNDQITYREMKGEYDIPADWIWSLFRVDEENQPIRRSSAECWGIDKYTDTAYLPPGQSQLELPSEAGAILGDYRSLNKLALANLLLPPGGWHGVGRSQSLQELQIQNCNLDDVTVMELRNMRQLRTLGLFDTDITDAGLETLKGNKDLQHLTLKYAYDWEGESSQHFPNLRKLSLDRVGLNDKGILQISRLPKLLELQVVHSDYLSAGSWACLRDSPDLRVLVIKQCPLDDYGVAGIARCLTIEKLTINEAQISDWAIDQISRMPNLKSLVVIDLEGNLTEESVKLLTSLHHPPQVEIVLSHISPKVLSAAQEIGYLIQSLD